MAKRFVIVALALLTACSGPVMKREDYDSIGYGATTAMLVENYGKPYEVTRYPDGLVEYHYIQRVLVRPDLVDEFHYYFTVDDEKVISKRCQSSGSSIDLKFSN